MVRTWILYKERKWQLDYFELRTIIVNDQEKRMLYASYKGKELTDETLAGIKGQLEKIFDNELKLEDTVDGH